MVLIIILFVVLGACLTLFLHELSHAIAVWSFGGTVEKFKPWPNKDENGRWWFGRVVFRYKNGYKFINMSPLVKSSIMIPIWILFYIFIYWPFIILAIWEVIDMLWWFKGLVFKVDGTDGYKALYK